MRNADPERPVVETKKIVSDERTVRYLHAAANSYSTPDLTRCSTYIAKTCEVLTSTASLTIIKPSRLAGHAYFRQSNTQAYAAYLGATGLSCLDVFDRSGIHAPANEDVTYSSTIADMEVVWP